MVPVEETCQRVILSKDDVKEKFTNLMARHLEKTGKRKEIHNLWSTLIPNKATTSDCHGQTDANSFDGRISCSPSEGINHSVCQSRKCKDNTGQDININKRGN